MDLKNSILLANMLKNKQEIKYMSITVVGSPTVVDYVVSSFSANDYIVNSRSFDITSNFEINLNLKTWSGTGSSQYIMGLIGNVNWSLYFGSSGAGIGSSYGGSYYWNSLASNMIVGIPTNINIKGDGTNITVTISQQGYSKTSTKTIAELGFNGNYTLNFGRGASSSLPFTSGEIDFNNSYEIRNGIKYNYQFGLELTKVGNPTIIDNIISGFSNNDFIYDANGFTDNGNDFEFCTCFKVFTMNTTVVMGVNNISSSYRPYYVSSSSGTQQKISNNVFLQSNYVLNNNSFFKSVFKRVSGTYYLEIYDLDDILLDSVSLTSGDLIGGGVAQNLSYGYDKGTLANYLNGEIDIDKSYQIRNGIKYKLFII